MMNPKARFSLFIFLVVSLVISGCIQTSSEPEIVRTRVIDEPPPSDDPPAAFDLTVGAQLFEDSCAPCHGEQGLGDGPAASGFTCEMPKLALAPFATNLTQWYDIATNGKRSSETCIMPPWNQRLNGEQIWQVVVYAASLRHDQSLITRGTELLAQAENAEARDYLATTQWQVSRTDEDILQAIRDNSLSGYDFTATPNDADQQAVLVALRSQVYSSSPVVPLAAPVSTEEVADAAVTPAPVTTEEATDAAVAAATEAPQTFTLVGRIINGSAGGTIPADLEVTLRVVAINDEGNPEEIHTATQAITADQGFSFAEVPVNPMGLAVVETTFADIRQSSPEIFLSDITGETFTTDLTVYETTTDPANVVIAYAESLVDAVTADGAGLVFQNIEVTNNGDRIYIGDEQGRTLRIPIPVSGFNPLIDAIRNTETRFIQTQEEGLTVFYDTFPIIPQEIDRVGVRYEIVYTGSVNLETVFPYPVESLGVYISETRGLELESEQLSPIEGGELNGMTYAGFGLTTAPLPANTPLAFRVYDGERAQNASSTPVSTGNNEKSFIEENTTLILGLGILLIVAGGMFMVYDLQKTRLQAQASRPRTASSETILAEITALDEAYQAGQLTEDLYQEQRQALKAQLAQLLSAK